MTTSDYFDKDEFMQTTTQWENRLLDLAGHIQLPHAQPVFLGSTSLKDAYQKAEKITAKYSKSFHFASSLLPNEKRTAVRALYAFCRTVDDIVDEAKFEKNRDDELNYWRNVIQTASTQTDDLVALAWADTLTRYHIPRHYALQLIDGVARDLSDINYQTFDELATYCYGVASTVGLMSMYIVGFKSGDAVPYAIKLGVALQMTNILRDVGEDYRNGRLYLPQEELKQFNISEEDIAHGRLSENWKNFMKFQIERNRVLYEESWAGIKLLEKEGQLAIGAASIFYQGILDVIEKNNYDVFTKRASLSKWGKIQRLIKLILKI